MIEISNGSNEALRGLLAISNAAIEISNGSNEISNGVIEISFGAFEISNGTCEISNGVIGHEGAQELSASERCI